MIIPAQSSSETFGLPVADVPRLIAKLRNLPPEQLEEIFAQRVVPDVS